MPTPINISASRGAAILGLSEWATPLQVWLQIMESREPGFCADHGYELPVIEYSPAMRWGHAFESAIIELAEVVQDRKILNREKLFPNPEDTARKTGYALIDPYITCHVDGEYSERYDEYGDGVEIENSTLHEGKTTSAFYYRDHFGEPGTDRVPIEYQVQCQHQMICTGAERVILSVLVFPKRPDEWEAMGYILVKSENGLWRIENEKFINAIDPIEWARVLAEMGYFHQYEIHANPELQSFMLNAYREWWDKYVIGKTPPEPKNYDDIRKIYREPVGTLVATEDVERLMIEYRLTLAEVGSAQKNNETVKTQVLDWVRKQDPVIDDESRDRTVLRDRAGNKLAQYSKNKNGVLIFR